MAHGHDTHHHEEHDEHDEEHGGHGGGSHDVKTDASEQKNKFWAQTIFWVIWIIFTTLLVWTKINTKVLDGTFGNVFFWILFLCLIGTAIYVWVTYNLLDVALNHRVIVRSIFSEDNFEGVNGGFIPWWYQVQATVNMTDVTKVTPSIITYPGGKIEKEGHVNGRAEYETADGSIVFGSYQGIFRPLPGHLARFLQRNPSVTATTADNMIDRAIGVWCKTHKTDYIFKNYEEISNILANLFGGTDTISQFEEENAVTADNPQCYQFGLSTLSKQAAENLYVAKMAAKSVKELIKTGKVSSELGMDAFLLLTGKGVKKEMKSYELKQLEPLLAIVEPFLADYLKAKMLATGGKP